MKCQRSANSKAEGEHRAGAEQLLKQSEGTAANADRWRVVSQGAGAANTRATGCASRTAAACDADCGERGSRRRRNTASDVGSGNC